MRLTALGIAEPSAADPGEAARRLLALQGQDYAGALWSLGLRTPGSTAVDVQRAFDDGELVRSWPFRSTLHVVAADDVGWMVALTGDRELAKTAGRHRQLGLEASDFARAEAIARDRLRGTRLERRELLTAFADEGMDVSGQRGAHLLVRLAQSGVAVLTGKDTWRLLEDHVPSPRRLDRDAALAEIARRFLTARGPATDRDLAWWTGLTLTDVRAAIAAVDDEFDRLELDGVVYRMRSGLAEAAPGIHLLPGFDEYLLGYTDRSAPLDGRPLSDVVPGSNGMFLATILVDGRVVGTWRRSVGRAGVTVDLAPFAALTERARRGVADAAVRYAAYLGVPLAAVNAPG
jgi:hypothetical protein